MRRAALAAAVLGLAGCGPGEETGEGEGSGACAAAIIYEGALYLGVGGVDGLPPQGAPAGEAVHPGCDDGGGPEDDRRVAVRAVSGVPRAVALYADGHLYVDHGYSTELPEHPLHAQLGENRRARLRGRACRLDGEIFMTEPLWVTAGGRRVNVVIDRRTRIDGFDRAGLPYLEEGDRVHVEGRGCRDDTAVARRIQPRG